MIQTTKNGNIGTKKTDIKTALHKKASCALPTKTGQTEGEIVRNHH